MAFRHPRLTMRLLYSSLHCDVQASEATLASKSRRPLTIFTNVHNNQTKFDIINYVHSPDRYLNQHSFLCIMEAYQKRSLATVLVLVGFTAIVGFLVSSFQGGLTGAVVSYGGVACTSNADCSDNIACTIDSCKNAGEELSFCVNSYIDYCQTGDGCCPAGCTLSTDNDCRT
jgi:hypothetical protein